MCVVVERVCRGLYIGRIFIGLEYIGYFGWLYVRKVQKFLFLQFLDKVKFNLYCKIFKSINLNNLLEFQNVFLEFIFYIFNSIFIFLIYFFISLVFVSQLLFYF